MTRKKLLITTLGTASVILFGIIIASSFYFYHIGIERKTQDLITKNMNIIQMFQQSKLPREPQPLKQYEPQLEPTEPQSYESTQTHPYEPGELQPSEQEQTLSIMAAAELPDSDRSENNQGWVESQPYETWTITSEDGLKLVGYYIPARIATTRTVIMAHGYGGRAVEMNQYARLYSEKLGYNVLLPDARGHGASEGSYIGMGWPERKDYLLWIRKIIDWVGYDSQIALHGLSMGGATVMMASGEALPQQVKAIVEDSGYTSVYEELAYQLKSMYKLPAFPFISAASLLTDIKAGYNFSEASSLKQVEKNKTPMLFIHGVLDKIVPQKMALQLYDSCKSEKELYLVKDAGHGMAFNVNPSAYERIVTDFLSRFIDSPQIIY